MSNRFSSLSSVTKHSDLPDLQNLAHWVASGNGNLNQARLVMRVLRSIREYEDCLHISRIAGGVPEFREFALLEMINVFAATSDTKSIEKIAENVIRAGASTYQPLINKCLNSLIDIREIETASKLVKNVLAQTEYPRSVDLVRIRLALLTKQFDEVQENLVKLGEKAEFRDLAAVGLTEIRMHHALEESDWNSFSEAQWINFFEKLGKILSYRHDFMLRSGRRMFEVARIRSHTPAGRPEFNFREWDLIQRELGSLRGQRVLDIGAADGFFSVKAAMSGADVVYLEPQRAAANRARAIFDYYGVSDRITIETEFFGERTISKYGKFDVIFALGLIYHLDNILHTMHLLSAISDTLMIETIAHDIGYISDLDSINYSVGDSLSRDWLTDFMVRQGYTVQELSEWREFCKGYEQTRDRTFFIAHR